MRFPEVLGNPIVKPPIWQGDLQLPAVINSLYPWVVSDINDRSINRWLVVHVVRFMAPCPDPRSAGSLRRQDESNPYKGDSELIGNYAQTSPGRRAPGVASEYLQ